MFDYVCWLITHYLYHHHRSYTYPHVSLPEGNRRNLKAASRKQATSPCERFRGVAGSFADVSLLGASLASEFACEDSMDIYIYIHIIIYIYNHIYIYIYIHIIIIYIYI